MSAKTVFGAAIALILMFLHVYLVWSATEAVNCSTQEQKSEVAATSPPSSPGAEKAPSGCSGIFTEPMGSALSLIGGLIAALVIAELALTQPGQAPGARAFAVAPAGAAARILNVVTGVYMGTWVVCGVCALMIGWKHPNAVPALTDLGQA